MTQVASKSSPTVRRNTRKDQPTTNDKNGVNQHDSNDQDERDLSIVDRDDSDRDDTRRDNTDRDEQNSRDERNEHGDWHRERNGRSGSVQRSVRSNSDGDLLKRSAEAFQPATANPFEAFGPMFDVSKVFSAMFAFTTGVVKLQQEAFASLIGATNTNGGFNTDTDTDGQNTRTSHSDRPGRKQNRSESRTDSSQSDRLDYERR